MIAQALAFSAIVAVAQAKAIITNQCDDSIYLWSVPYSQDKVSNFEVGPGERYEEFWRPGTSVNPGIAIKASFDVDGIYEESSEINYQYTVEYGEVWISLATVRGGAFDDDVTFFTCHGSYDTADVPPQRCALTDDVELVLCGDERAEPPIDTTPLDFIQYCANPPLKPGDKKPARRSLQCNGRVVGTERTLQANTTAKPNNTVAVDKLERKAKTVSLKDLLEGGCSWAHNGTDCLHSTVDKLVTTLSHSVMGRPKLYLSSVCLKFFPATGCHKVKQFMKKEYPQFHWSTDLESEEENVASYPRPLPPISHRTTVNIESMCKTFIPAFNCTQVGVFMEMRNPGYRIIPGSKVEARPGNVKKDSRKPVRCINGFCRWLKPILTCDDAKDALEHEDPYHDYTTDSEKGCHLS